MKNRFLIILLIVLVCNNIVSAQFRTGRFGRGFGAQKNGRPRRQQQLFKPTLDLSVGYGYPNLDKDLLPEFTSYYKGNISQSGPVTLALNYRFMQRMSVGVMVMNGKTSVPYYDYTNSGTQAFTGSLENTAIVLNIMKYVPVNGKISPYVRTAIGLNIWKQNYVDNRGNHINPGVVLPDLAYQAAFGLKINLSNNAGLFAEAGYGKYILHGGLSLKL